LSNPALRVNLTDSNFLDIITPIYEKRSKYQSIQFGTAKGKYILLLDGREQYIYPGEEKYHSALIDTAVHLFGKKPNNVLIVGGGDGFAARNALKLGAKKVTIVDIDKEVINLSKNHPIAAKLNNYSLRNKNVRVIIDDALKIPDMGLGEFDVISMDLTDPVDTLSKKLYSKNFVSKLVDMLPYSGVISGYKQKALLGRFGGSSLRMVVKVPDMGIADIYYFKKDY
jgi:spermidine synthase